MVKRSPQGTEAKTSGDLRGFAKTSAPSAFLEQSMKPISSAIAAEATRANPTRRIRNRLRNIAPPRPGDTTSHQDIYEAWKRRRKLAQRTGCSKTVLTY